MELWQVPLLFSRLPMFPFFDLAHYVASVMALKEQRGERRRLAGRDGASPPRAVFPCRPPVCPRLSSVCPAMFPPAVFLPPRPPAGPGQRRGPGSTPAAGRPGWARAATAQDGGGRLRGAGVAGTGLGRGLPGGARGGLRLPGLCRWVSVGAAGV